MKKIQKRSKKKIIYIALAVIVVLAASLFVLEKTRTTNFLTNPFYKKSAFEVEQQKKDQANKNDPTIGNKGTAEGSSQGFDATKNTSQIPDTDEFTITLDSFKQANGAVVVSAGIKDTISTEQGTCSFTFTREQVKPVAKSASASESACSTSIPELEFSAVGEWILEIRYFNSNKQASANQKVTIR